jgi:alanine dehydrogenase
VESGTGRGLGIPDNAYARAGARITDTQTAWGSADFLLKLKAPAAAEVGQIRGGASLSALFHAEGTPDVVTELLARQITAYSFEYFQDDRARDGRRGRHPDSAGRCPCLRRARVGVQARRELEQELDRQARR